MIDGLEAARDAAYAYTPRNDGEEGHILFIRACLDDAHLRASMLDDYANEHARSQATAEAHARAAQAASDLQAAQSATAASLTPDTAMHPEQAAGGADETA